MVRVKETVAYLVKVGFEWIRPPRGTSIRFGCARFVAATSAAVWVEALVERLVGGPPLLDA